MKSPKLIQDKINSKPISWIFGGLVLVTLYIQTNLADPFNSPKQWVLLIVASWLIGYVISFRKIIISNKSILKLFFILVVFNLSSLFATVFSDFQYISVFGDTQRRNGYISYFALAIVMLASAQFIRLKDVNKLLLANLFVASISVTYAILQTTGNDFIKWNNPYNSVITTLGNPNFSAAVMAIMGILLFATIFSHQLNNSSRIFAFTLTFVLLYAIFRSNAKQGLLTYILGISIFMIVWISSKNKLLGIALSFIGTVVLLFSILGMLQEGPLERFLYKPSVSLRGHYWRTAIDMFQNNPVLGVGMDRYGAFFKEYRSVDYPLTYGYDITSTNAHNTFLQFFATGGIFLGTSYLILNLYIFKCAVTCIRKSPGNDKIAIIGVFSAWIGFHAQSLISIDNLGISIWGWVLGGTIIGISISSHNSVENGEYKHSKKPNQINLSRSLISGVASLLIIVLISLLYRGENNTYKTMLGYNLQNEQGKDLFKESNLKTINSALIDPTYALNSAINLIEAGFIELGLATAKGIYEDDPRNLTALNQLAAVNEKMNNTSEAIKYREIIVKLDPWNAVNYFNLGKNYKIQNNQIKANAMLQKILSFDSDSDLAQQAVAELSS